MRSEAQTMIDAIRKSLALLSRRMDRDTADERLSDLDGLLEDPDLWDDPKRAQELMKRRQELSESIESYDSILRELEDAVELIDMAIEENESEVAAEAEAALSQLQERTSRMELEALLDGEADENDAFLEINAGAGGTESCDWALMLSRMYEKMGAKTGFQVRDHFTESGRRSRAQVDLLPIFRPQCVRLAQNGKRACTAWCEYLRSTVRRGDIPPSVQSPCIRSSTRTLKLKSIRLNCASTPSVRPARAGST